MKKKSLIFLLCGIFCASLVLPKPVPAIILLCLGVGGAIANLIVWLKKNKNVR